MNSFLIRPTVAASAMVLGLVATGSIDSHAMGQSATCESAPAVAVGQTTFNNASNTASQVVTTATGTTTIAKAGWFKFTPTATSNYEISLCGSVNDTKIAIGTACPGGGNFTSLAYNDDACPCASGCGGNWSSRLNSSNSELPLTQPLQAGTTYYIVVGSYSTTVAATSGTMTISAVAPPQPPNTCTNPVAGVVGTNNVTLDPAGLSLGGLCTAPVNKPGYVRFVPPTSGFYEAATCTAGLDTAIAVMTECGVEGTILDCDDDGCGTVGAGSIVSFEGTAGQPVFIAVGLWSTTAAAPAGAVPLVISVALPPVDPCADPPVATVGTNQLPMNPAAPNFVVGQYTIWKCNFMSFTPTQSGIFTVKNCADTGFDSWVLAATACGDANSVVSGGRGQCLNAPGPGIASFAGDAGVTYYIGVGGYSATSVFPAVSTVEITAQYCTEGFDPCAAPLTVTNGVTSVPIDCGAPNLDLSCCWFPEFGDPAISKANFVKYVAPSSGPVTVSACGQCVDSRLAVLSSCTSAPDATAFIDADDDGCGDACFSSRLTFEATAGTTYYIAIGGYVDPEFEETLPAQMSIEISQPVDPCAPANVRTAVIGNNVVVPSSAYPTLDLTGSPCPLVPPSISRAQYLRFTPTATGLHLFEQCADTTGTVDARMGIMTACGDALSILVCDDDGCTGGAPWTSRFEAELQAGTTYFLVVGGYNDAQAGPFNVEIIGPGAGQCIPDLNDDQQVNGDDLALLLTSWGPCTGCPADFNQSGQVDGDDLATLLTAWGPCP